ncbi:hypothetical protein CCR75_004438 [Bremia lactucae]|uniref:Uncharacterized protein n=1 Tax=Bremia lactucae TaxID=4779 RepID=A0A976IID4_BRELC|nr:hypothetical protein CCR75_004438 [Bremia lactucae]
MRQGQAFSTFIKLLDAVQTHAFSQHFQGEQLLELRLDLCDQRIRGHARKLVQKKSKSRFLLHYV